MFTGLVSDVGEVTAISRQGDLARLRIACSYAPGSIAVGASIACSGPCLTAVAVGVEQGRTWFEADAAAETLARTTIAGWRRGARVNLERSLKIGEDLGGHLVTGHIDGLARILERREVDGAARFAIRAPWDLARFIAEKGSVALDGTSLTVNTVEDDRFSVLLIPHSLAVTTWSERQANDDLNLEIDLMARYAARLAQCGRTVEKSTLYQQGSNIS